MTISLGNAIKCIKEDEKWVKKILVLGLIYIAFTIAMSVANYISKPIITLLFYTIGIIGLIWVCGFIFSSMNKIANSDKFQMAELNEKNLLLVGCKSTLSILVYCVLATVVLFAFTIVCGLVLGLVGGIIFGILGAITGFDNPILSTCVITFSTVIGLLIGLYFVQLINTAFAFYFKSLKFGNLISFKKHFLAISENKRASWTLIGKTILFSLAYIAIMCGLLASIVGILLMPFVMMSAYFVVFNLIDQYAKEINIEKYL